MHNTLRCNYARPSTCKYMHPPHHLNLLQWLVVYVYVCLLPVHVWVGAHVAVVCSVCASRQPLIPKAFPTIGNCHTVMVELCEI